MNLRQAVDDASIADGAAAVRFPLALKSLPDSVLEVVPGIVADIVEEQTGSRPVMTGLKPELKLEGTHVKLTLNCLGQDDLGKLSLGDLTKVAVSRTTTWVGHAITLIAAVSSTNDRLSFEQDTLDALLDGFAASGWKKTAAASIPGGDDPKVASATAAKPRVRARERRRRLRSASRRRKGRGPLPQRRRGRRRPSRTSGLPRQSRRRSRWPSRRPQVPEPSATVAPEASPTSQLAPGTPAVCGQYAKAACNDPTLPAEIDRKQFCAGVYRRVNGFAQSENPTKTCTALLKDLSAPRAAR